MATVSLSSKFQIVIPKKVREEMNLTAGAKIEIIPYAGSIELIVLRPVQELRGSIKGIDTSIKRKKDRL